MSERNQSAYIQIDLLYLLRKGRVEEVFRNPRSGVVHQNVYLEIMAYDVGDKMVDCIGR